MNSLKDTRIAAFLALILSACTAGLTPTAGEQAAAYYNASQYESIADSIMDTSSGEDPFGALSDSQVDMVSASQLAAARTLTILRDRGVNIPSVEDPIVLVDRHLSGEVLPRDQQAFCIAFLELFHEVLSFTLADFSACVSEGAANVVACALARRDFGSGMTAGAGAGGAAGPAEQWILTAIVVVVIIVIVAVTSHNAGRDRARAEAAAAAAAADNETMHNDTRECVDRNAADIQQILLILRNNELDDEERDRRIDEILEQMNRGCSE